MDSNHKKPAVRADRRLIIFYNFRRGYKPILFYLLNTIRPGGNAYPTRDIKDEI